MTNQTTNPKPKSLVILNVMKDLCPVPQLNFDLLLAFSIGKPKEFLYSHPEYPISIIQYLRFRWFIHLYRKGYSIAAIVGHKEFYGLDFFVNKHVLIPRPDTELMVAEATRIMNDELRIKDTNITYIDVGTGSGCIPIAVLKNLTEPITTYATDIYRSALRVAKKNARIHNVNIKFFHGNLLEPIFKNPSLCLSPYRGERNELLSVVPSPIRGGARGGVFITANLPYLSEQQFQSEPSIWREPKIALVANNNGLALYEELLQQIKIAGLNATIFLEIDPSQTEKIKDIIKKYSPNAITEIKKDLAGRDRLVIIKLLTL
jgi:release factor glutamine methyltransferase